MTLSSPLRFDIEDTPSDADVEILTNGLKAFSESRWPGRQPWRPLAVFAREGGSIVAGLAGETYAGWLFVRYLWVGEALRGKGIGRKLMADAEALALERGCHSARVDTFTFQAPASIPNSAIRCSANSTTRPDTSGSFCRSGSRAGPEAAAAEAGVQPRLARATGCAVLVATQPFQLLNCTFLSTGPISGCGTRCAILHATQ